MSEDGKTALELLQEHSVNETNKKKLISVPNERPSLSFVEFDLFSPTNVNMKENIEVTTPSSSTIEHPKPADSPIIKHVPSLKSSQLLKEKEKKTKSRAKVSHTIRDAWHMMSHDAI